MSSHESSGAAAEGSATNPAPAAPASFGTTRGSGLARGKRPSSGPAPASAAASPSEYKPTAIEIVNAPREYQNPFAPAESAPVAETPQSVVKSSLPEPTPAVAAPKADITPSEDIAAPEADEVAKAELNILPPERPKVVEAQTWESEGFTAPAPRADRSERSERFERPRREERAERPESDEPIDAASIPEKFLYVRPGVTFVPTDPRKWGPGRRDPSPERSSGLAPRESAAEAPVARAESEAPRKSGGLFGWIKSLFGGGSSETATAGAASGEHRGPRSRHEARGDGSGERRHRSGGGGGGGRRRRGGRGRGPGGGRGEGPGGDRGPSGARNGDAT